MENKVVTFGVVDGKFQIVVDPNQDGQPVLSLIIDIAEIPDEVAALFTKKA